MSFLTDEEKSECERVFNYLDKNKDQKLNIEEVILGLGTLGKICSVKEQKKIESKGSLFDLEAFIEICEQKVDFKNLDNNLISYFEILESKERPGYISVKNLKYILKKFDENISDKKIKDIVKEVGEESDEFINIEELVKEMLIK